MDIIHIKNLEVFANHGVFEEENTLGQKFVINADLYTDFSDAVGKMVFNKGLRHVGYDTDGLELFEEGLCPAGYSPENLDESIDYGVAAQMIADFLTQDTYELIETAASRLAQYLLLSVPHLKQIHLEIKKPWAPVRLPLETVSVELTRGWHKVYLSLGSNIGEREKYIQNALNALKSHSCIAIDKVSPIYETEPYGGVEQPGFLNCCVSIDTILEPNELLDYLHVVEAANNRTREIHWGPRTLDIDILLYDELVMHTQKLCIPHIDMHNRVFVLKPLCDIAPYAYHPVKRAVVQELLANLEKNNN